MIEPEPTPGSPTPQTPQTPEDKHVMHPAANTGLRSANLLASPAAPAGPSLVTSLFFGDDGFRAGWSFLLFALLTYGLALGAGNLIRHFHLLPHATTSASPQPESPRRPIVGDGLNFALLLVASACMAFIERRPFARYGLGLRHAFQDLALGLLWGFTMLSVLIALLLAAHAIVFDGFALHGATALTFSLKWAAAFLLVGLFEEFFTRGYLQFTIARGVSGLVRYIAPASRHAHLIGFWVAAFLFSVCLFMAGHIGNSGETFAGIAAVGLAGAVFAFSLYRTGTLWWAIGLHAAWDWAQTFFYGVSDSGIAATGHLLNSHPTGRPLLSGGTTGPEGSLFVIPTLLLVAVVIHYTLPRRDYPLTAAQTPDPVA